MYRSNLLVYCFLTFFMSLLIACTIGDTLKASEELPKARPYWDQYGGDTSIKGTATGFFHTEKLGDRWWLITPEGNAFFALSVSVVSCADSFMDSTGLTLTQNLSAKYAIGQGPADGFTDTRSRCAYYARERLRQWGFNTIGTFSYPPSVINFQFDRPVFPPMGSKPSNLMPQVMTQRNAAYAMRDGGVKSLYGPVWGKAGGSSPYFPDVFDPGFATFVDQNAQKGSWGNSPWVLYAFMDQTDEMRGVNNYHTHLGFIAAATAPTMASDSHAFGGAKTYSDSTMYSKLALRNFLQGRYGSVTALNTAWGTSYTSWDSAGGWGVGTGFLDENGKNLGNWSALGSPTVAANPQKPGFPAVRQDLDDFAATLMRQFYRTVFQAYRLHKPHHLLTTNNMAAPHQYVYKGLLSEDGTQTYADVVFVDDLSAGGWSDRLNRPFMGKLKGVYTAENDSPLGYQGMVEAVQFDDVAQTITITASGVNFWWAGNPLYKLNHYVYTQFSSLPTTLTKNFSSGPKTSNQYYRSSKPDWLATNKFVVRSFGSGSGTYAELKAAIKPGDTFRRVMFFTPDAPFDRQEDRGTQYAKDLAGVLSAISPNGTHFVVGVNWWAYADRSWINHFESFNFGLVTIRDNAYDGVEASFSSGVDQFGFTRISETPPPHLTGQAGFGDFLGQVTQANRQVYLDYPDVPSDTTAPAAAFTAPVNGATVSGRVNVSLLATDSVGVNRIQLYLDGALVGTYAEGSATYVWDVPVSLSGSHTFTARAWDAAGNVGSTSVTVKVNAVPEVRITSPSNDATVQGFAVPISVDFMLQNPLRQLILYQNSKVVSGYNFSTTTTKGTKELNWNVPTTPGIYTIKVTATDSTGRSSESASIQVTVVK